MDTKGSGLSVVPLVKIVKVVSGVVTMGSMLGSTMGSAVFFSSVPKCKFETGLKLFERYIIIRGFTKFGIKVSRRLQFLEYLRTLHLKFQKARTKTEVVLSLPCWLAQLNHGLLNRWTSHWAV